MLAAMNPWLLAQLCCAVPCCMHASELTVNHCDIALCFKKTVTWRVAVDHHTPDIGRVVIRREIESSTQLVTEKETRFNLTMSTIYNITVQIWCTNSNQDLFLMGRCIYNYALDNIMALMFPNLMQLSCTRSHTKHKRQGVSHSINGQHR